MIEVTGKCIWEHVTQPNTIFEPWVWSIDIQVDDDNKELIFFAISSTILIMAY